MENILKSTRNNRIHYLKWDMSADSNISIRFYFMFQDRKNLEGKFVLKNHDEGEYVEIDESTAKFLIKNITDGKVAEISGYRRDHGVYIKNIFVGGGMFQITERNGTIKSMKEFRPVQLNLDIGTPG